MAIIDVKTAQGVKQLEEFLSNKSYICGYEPTKADVETFSALEVSQAKTPNVLRWYNHIKSFSDKERAQFPDQKSEFIVTAGSSAKSADDEDDVDLFGSDDEEV